MEPSKQFSHGLSFVGFLIYIVKLSNVDWFLFFGFFFLQDVNDTRDEKMLAVNLSPAFGFSVEMRWLVAGKV